MRFFCRLSYIVFLTLFTLKAGAQSGSFASGIIAVIDTFNICNPSEKVFIHTDKPFYALTDTIWLKAYVLDGALTYSKQSGLLYTELINDTGKVIIRQSMPVKLGVTFGQIVIDPKLIPPGTYQLRAYTNWMQNLNSDHFFNRTIQIGNADADGWLFRSDSRIENRSGKANLSTAIIISDKNGAPARLKQLELKVMNGNNVLSNSKLQTDLNGKLDINFDLPGQINPGKLYLVAADVNKGTKGPQYIIPLTSNRPEFIDLQFMPESGRLIAGLPTRIGFKAITEDGTGTTVNGEILNSKGVVVNTFNSLYKGIGSFELQAEAGETYTAQLKLPGGRAKTYPLPVVKPSGINLRVDNIDARDSLSVTIDATPDISGGTNGYLLVAQSAGRIAYAANLNFAKGIIHGSISKNRFSSGITRFTLLNLAQQPIAERLVFINHHDQLKIAVNTTQAIHPKDSVGLLISVTDKDGKPVSGSFSLAVTDNQQVRADSLNTPNLLGYMLLTGDLKGEIETPGYYFDEKNRAGAKALDNLLLTQGWVGYSWPDVFNPKYQPKFKAEPEIVVSGQVNRLGGKSVNNLPVALLSAKKPFLAMDTVSDVNGRFTFRNLPRVDTANFMVQVKDKKGKMFEATVSVDEFVPAKEPTESIPIGKPWYVNSDTTLLNYMKQSDRYHKEFDLIKYPAGSTQLRNVVINDKKVVKGSHNLNGSGNADQVLDEKDLIKAGTMSLMDLLYKQVKGFTSITQLVDHAKKVIRTFYAIYDKQVKIIIDGMELDLNITPDDIANENSYANYVRNKLLLLTAEDVRGIEVIYNNNYSAKYKKEFNVSVAPAGATPGSNTCYNCLPPKYTDLAYLEITTWAGTGVFSFRKSGVYLYRPLPVTWPKVFYKPKYIAKSNNTLADLRATIHWEPNIITDSAGKATVWFYAKSKSGKYTTIIQGANLEGQVGYHKVELEVK